MSFVAYNDQQQQEQNSHRRISLEEDSDSASTHPSDMLIVPDIATSASTIAYDSDLTDEDKVEIVAHRSEIAQYDVLLRNSSNGSYRYEIDASTSHVGNARFAIMIGMVNNKSQDVDETAANIVRTLYKECNGRLLLPTSADCEYYRDVGATAKAMDMVKQKIASSSSETPAAGAATSEDYEIDIPIKQTHKRPRRSSLRPSSFLPDAVPSFMDTSAPHTNNAAASVHFTVPIPMSELTASDLLLNDKKLRNTDNVGNNRLRVMISMVSARYSDVKNDPVEAKNVAEEIVHRVLTRRDAQGNKGRFLDINYNIPSSVDGYQYVEISREAAIVCVQACLNEEIGVCGTSASTSAPTISNKNNEKSNAAALPTPVPSVAMPPSSDLQVLRRKATEDMLKKRRRQVKTKSGGKAHGGHKGFSSTLQDDQIESMQEIFRRMAQENVCVEKGPKVPSSLLNNAIMSIGGIRRPNNDTRRPKGSQARAA